MEFCKHNWATISETNSQSVTGKWKGIWVRDRARGRREEVSLPPSLPPSFALLAFSRSQNPLHFPFERLPCKIICNRIYTVPCERVAQVKNSSVEKPEKFKGTGPVQMGSRFHFFQCDNLFIYFLLIARTFPWERRTKKWERFFFLLAQIAPWSLQRVSKISVCVK